MTVRTCEAPLYFGAVALVVTARVRARVTAQVDNPCRGLDSPNREAGRVTSAEMTSACQPMVLPAVITQQ